MRIRQGITPYIYLLAALLPVAAITGGCVSGGGTKDTPAQAQAAAGNGQVPSCKSAIDDVTRYCSGDRASTGKCTDAKTRTREHCIN